MPGYNRIIFIYNYRNLDISCHNHTLISLKKIAKLRKDFLAISQNAKG